MKLESKVAIVSGGSSGIGLAAARLFAAEGASVVIAARDEQRGRKALLAVEREGGQALFVRCDVAKSGDCLDVVEAAVRAFGRLDILFNNAGVIHAGKSVVDTTEEEWADTMDVNVKGTYLMSRHAIPLIAVSGGGAIVNNASIWGLVGGALSAAYCASKGAVVLLTKAMAIDHAAQNIRVNCVCPGSVDTSMLEDEMAELGGREEVMASIAARHPLNRIASPDEVARAVLFLACDDSSFITGTALPVDGGRSAW